MDWEAHITADPAVLVGKPVIRGTRLSVEHVLDLLAGGWSEADVISNYPQITAEDVRACLRYAAALTRRERAFPAPAA